MRIQEYINLGWNIESYIYVTVILFGIVTLIYFLRLNWKLYGLLFLLATIIGNVLCYIFVKLGFYSYPYVLFPKILIMPVTAVTFAFPAFVLIGVYFSPVKWVWKIPFYWTLIHIGMFCETYALNKTRIIEYNFKWDFWDSYTWWWIFFLLFEWIGGLIIPSHLRRPINLHHLQYGRIGWAIIHFVLIVTIFLGGYYVGTMQ
ncbi:CBO0543 family protein [Salirhabdus salicampi]|uniref:CBO0543 family protein n=1 Tax=Salirhabdus salicampi TaxID=476102 RepID=UPI0020C3E0C1|nr:CBO0543 family protein [Salirhabdus salicampi]MCP8615418.1 hypothetical protein [Salirhabdus salicampi]